VKFHFVNSKLNKKHFSTKILTIKYQISKPRGEAPTDARVHS